MSSNFPVEKIRQDFPILQQKINGKPLIYLDNAATTQKPQAVIDALKDYYTHNNANIHRGVHTLSERATAAYENTREIVRQFINADAKQEIIFVRGTTEAINLVANSFGQLMIKPKDEIIISAMEHHSNIVPWQLLAERNQAQLKIIPMNNHGELLLDEYQKLFSPRTKIVAITHVSNALGTINPIEKMIATAHQHGVPVLIDGAQAAPHLAIDVKKLDCDFYTLSSHKLYGPTGIGVLYGKKYWLEKMPPYQGGGDMIKMVSFEKTIYNDLPFKFEAGTPNIADTIAFSAAINYVKNIGLESIAAYEHGLLNYALNALQAVKNLRFIGTAKERASAITFILENIHPHDVGTILNSEGIAVRTGHHCAMPVMEFFQVPATVRASFSFYNTIAEIDQLVTALYKVNEVFN